MPQKNNKKGKKGPSSGQPLSLFQRLQSTLGNKKTASNASIGYYTMYKEATLEFHNWMSQDACPKARMSAVNDYRHGVQHIWITTGPALMLRDPTLDIPSLQNTDAVFKDTKAVWVGGKPEKGSSATMFLMSLGVNSRHADRLVSERAAKKIEFYEGVALGSDATRRKMDRMRPEEYSASYRRLVQHDFGSEDKEKRFTNRNATSSEKTAEAKKYVNYKADLLRRLNVAKDAMDDDGQLVLPVNFPAVGAILLEFMNALSDYMDWSRMMEGNRKSLIPFWCELLYCIDRDCPDKLTPEFDIDKVTAFTKLFFDKVERSRYIFFVEVGQRSTSNP